MSFSGRIFRVKGGVFFLFLRTEILATDVARIGSSQFWQIQAALAYTR